MFGGRQANLYVYVNNDPVNRRDPSGLGEVCNYSSQTIYVKDENSGTLVAVSPGSCNGSNDGVYNPSNNGFTDAPTGGLVRKFDNWTDINVYDEPSRTCNPNIGLNWDFQGAGDQLIDGLDPRVGWKDSAWAKANGFPIP